MTAESENNGSGFEDDELNTTAPQSEPEEWSMPEPVFRRTSGKLPQTFVKDAVVNEEADTTEPKETSQPSSANNTPPTYTSPEPRPKNPTIKLILVVLGLVAMVAFLVVFLTLVYFLFLR